MRCGKLLTQAEFQFTELASHIPFIKTCLSMNIRSYMNEANNLSKPGRHDNIRNISRGEFDMRLKFMALLMTMFAASGLIGISAYGYVQKDPAYPTAPCTDSQGATTGFFCQPLSTKGKLVAACDAKKPKDLASCQLGGANSYCVARGYSRSVSYNMDAKGNLSELVCSRAPVMSVAAAVPAPVEEWQPMFNVDLRGYDHREVPVANAQDWKACKAACDADGQCKALTLVPERKT